MKLYAECEGAKCAQYEKYAEYVINFKNAEYAEYAEYESKRPVYKIRYLDKRLHFQESMDNTTASS